MNLRGSVVQTARVPSMRVHSRRRISEQRTRYRLQRCPGRDGSIPQKANHINRNLNTVSLPGQSGPNAAKRQVRGGAGAHWRSLRSGAFCSDVARNSATHSGARAKEASVPRSARRESSSCRTRPKANPHCADPPPAAPARYPDRRASISLSRLSSRLPAPTRSSACACHRDSPTPVDQPAQSDRVPQLLTTPHRGVPRRGLTRKESVPERSLQWYGGVD